MRLVGDLLNVNIKLVDSESGFQVTSRNLEAKIEDFNRVLRDITNVAVANLRIVLPEGTQPVLGSMHEDAVVDAFILYRRGKETFEQTRTAESLAAAIDFYRTEMERQGWKQSQDPFINPRIAILRYIKGDDGVSITINTSP